MSHFKSAIFIKITKLCFWWNFTRTRTPIDNRQTNIIYMNSHAVDPISYWFKWKTENIQSTYHATMYNGFSTKIMFWIHTTADQKGENKICLWNIFYKSYKTTCTYHMNIHTVKGIITFMMYKSIQNSTCYRSS